MINYSTWPKKKILTTSLRLDLNNPRLSETTKKQSQNEIIDYLVNHEKVYELAMDIASKGYFLNELPIVVREKDKYHVLEGNRRVSASKILINPELVKSASKRKNLKEALKTFDIEIVKKLEVIIAPSREDADVMIVNRHTGGSAVEKWDKTKQDRFLYSRFIAGESVGQMAAKFPMTRTEIKDSLKRYNFYKTLCSIELDDDVKLAMLDENKFSITNLERAYQSKEGLAFMGFEFDEKSFGIIKKLPKHEFEKRMERIAKDVISGEINSRKLNTDADKKRYFEKLIKSGEFDDTIEPDRKYNDEYPSEDLKPIDEESEHRKKIPRTRKSTTSLMPATSYLDTGISRIDEIFYELKSLNLKRNPNAVSVLFRSYLDMLAYQFLRKMSGLDSIKNEKISKLREDNDRKFNKIKKELNKLEVDVNEFDEVKLRKAVGINDSLDRSDFIPSLKFMLSHIATSATLIEDDKLKQALQGYLRNDTKLLGHNDFNLLVHNEYYTSDADELQRVWTQMYPLLEYLVQQIKS